MRQTHLLMTPVDDQMMMTMMMTTKMMRKKTMTKKKITTMMTTTMMMMTMMMMTPAHLIENEPVAQATVPHIVLDMLSMLVVRQILQK